MYHISRNIASAIMMLVMVFAVMGLSSCKDSPCQIATTHKLRISEAKLAVKELGATDYFLAGLGSDKVQNTLSTLRSEVVSYRDHLSTCTNSHCEEAAKTEVAECDKVIKTLDSDMELQNLITEIGKLLGIILAL